MRAVWVAALLALLGATPAWADCTELDHPGAIQAQVDTARTAFLALDAGAFLQARDQMNQGVSCQTQAIAPTLAAQVHTVLAMAAYLDRDETGTVAAFQAAKAADPDMDLGAWLPAEHPAHVDHRFAGRLEPAPPRRLKQTPGETVYVDGTATDRLILGQPALLQHAPGKTVTAGTTWMPDQALPGWVRLKPEGIPKKAQRHLWLGGATTLAAASTLGLFAVGNQARLAYIAPNTPYERLDALQQRNKVGVIGGYTAATVTAVLGTTLVITW